MALEQLYEGWGLADSFLASGSYLNIVWLLRFYTFVKFEIAIEVLYLLPTRTDIGIWSIRS